MFTAYAEYNRAYLPLAERKADEYIGLLHPSRLEAPGQNGWTIGTGAWLYTIEGASKHSGPGTGAFTSMLLWDAYAFTMDAVCWSRSIPFYMAWQAFFPKH